MSAQDLPSRVMSELKLIFTSLAIYFAVLWHLYNAPFTKVEESFNLHAIYDILTYGELRDHRTFPGAVPRSFVPSMFFGFLAFFPINTLQVLFSKDLGLASQLLVRMMVGLANVLGLVAVQNAIRRRFGSTAETFYVLFTVTQFHVPFYASRTLPNMLALPLVTYALAWILERRRPRRAIACLVVAAVIVRAEIALLLAPLAVQMLVKRRISLTALIVSGLVSGTLALATTVLVDTYNWRWKTALWPELYSIWFNVYEGKSAEWGVSPPWDYILKHLPKLTTFALPPALVSPVASEFLIAPGIFILAMSALEHKEWRFIVYVVPFVNVAASVSATALWQTRNNTKIFRVLLIGGILGCALLSAFLSHVSSLNYPGGTAMQLLHQRVPFSSYPNVHVHICNKAAQTGASLFTFRRMEQGWVYNKTEHLTGEDLARGGFTHAVVEDWDNSNSGAAKDKVWDVLAEVKGFAGVKLQLPSYPRVKQETQLWILERRDALRSDRRFD